MIQTVPEKQLNFDDDAAAKKRITLYVKFWIQKWWNLQSMAISSDSLYQITMPLSLIIIPTQW